jgi:hypothetical protein
VFEDGMGRPRRAKKESVYIAVLVGPLAWSFDQSDTKSSRKQYRSSVPQIHAEQLCLKWPQMTSFSHISRGRGQVAAIGPVGRTDGRQSYRA